MVLKHVLRILVQYWSSKMPIDCLFIVLFSHIFSVQKNTLNNWESSTAYVQNKNNKKIAQASDIPKRQSKMEMEKRTPRTTYCSESLNN